MCDGVVMSYQVKFGGDGAVGRRAEREAVGLNKRQGSVKIASVVL